MAEVGSTQIAERLEPAPEGKNQIPQTGADRVVSAVAAFTSFKETRPGTNSKEAATYLYQRAVEKSGMRLPLSDMIEGFKKIVNTSPDPGQSAKDLVTLIDPFMVFVDIGKAQPDEVKKNPDEVKKDVVEMLNSAARTAQFKKTRPSRGAVESLIRFFTGTKEEKAK